MDLIFVLQKCAHNAGTRIYSWYFNQLNVGGRSAGWWQTPVDLA